MKQISIHNTLSFTFALLMIGIAYQHFFWFTPYLSFLWTESIFRALLELLSLNWTQFSSGPMMSMITDIASILLGIIFLLAVISTTGIFKDRRQTIFMNLSIYLFLFFTLLNWFEHDLFISAIFEKSSQIGCVLLIYLFINKDEISSRLLLNIIRICTALTFTFHGLYALNFFPLPGHFVDMTISVLRVSEPLARKFLSVVGILDILISFGLFYNRTAKVSFIYAIIWGFLTASARIVANVSLDGWIVDLHRWFFEFLIRTPNFLLPLAGILLRVQNVMILDGFNGYKRKKIA